MNFKSYLRGTAMKQTFFFNFFFSLLVIFFSATEETNLRLERQGKFNLSDAKRRKKQNFVY